MNLNIHTPAPWESSLYSSGEHGIYASHGKGNDIALVRAGHDTEINKANAQLIAAAPELLIALQRIVALHPSSTILTEIKSAQEAIAKATGEPA
jgi:hypothetical protein